MATNSEGRALRRVPPADPLGLLALIGAGAMSAHQIGSLVPIARPVVAVSHSYFSIAVPLAILLVFAAAWASALKILRHAGAVRPRWWQLAVGQTALFVAMEVAEHAVADSMQGLLSPQVLLGFALQPIVAWLALRILDLGHAVLERLFVGTPTSVASPVPPAIVSFVQRVREHQLRNSLHVRGPPVI